MTKMSYAEAVKRAEKWLPWFETSLCYQEDEDEEALDVLKRAEKVMEAVEGAKHLPDCAKRVEFLVTKFKYGYEGAPEELTILRAALAYRAREAKEKP